MGSKNIGANHCCSEWQLDNDGQPLQDSEDSEGSEDAEALNKIQGTTERSALGKIMRSPGVKHAAHMAPGPDDTAPFGGSMHKNRDLKSTFLIDRDSDAKASWRRGHHWTGEWSKCDKG